MNYPNGFDEEWRRREWQLQERAMSDEREAADPVAPCDELAKHRLIARALRHPRLDALPDDFVLRTVARVEGTDASGDRVEKWLQRALFAVLFVASAVACVLLGGDRLARELASGPPMSWILVVVGCLALSLPTQRRAQSAARDLLRPSPCSSRRP